MNMRKQLHEMSAGGNTVWRVKAENYISYTLLSKDNFSFDYTGGKGKYIINYCSLIFVHALKLRFERERNSMLYYSQFD